MMAGFEPVPIPERLKIQKIQNRVTEFSSKIKSVDDKNIIKNDDDDINNNSNCNNSYNDNDNNISNDKNNDNNDNINNNDNNNNDNYDNNNNYNDNNDNDNNDDDINESDCKNKNDNFERKENMESIFKIQDNDINHNENIDENKKRKKEKNTITVQLNELLGAKSMKINSQLNVSTYLNSKKLTNHGVALCCDTEVGILSVNNLIRNWSGRVLSISVNFYCYFFILVFFIYFAPNNSLSWTVIVFFSFFLILFSSIFSL